MSNYFDNSDAVDAWFEKRRSKFTASANYRLGTPIYVEEKVIELTTALWERPELEEVKSLLHGRFYEYPAYQRYIKETKNNSMIYMGMENPLFIEWDKMKEESGGTPDIVNYVKDSIVKIDYGCEIKCPRNPAYHFRRLNWTSQWDIKENYLQCYTQIQNLIMITGAFGFDFVSYDERQLARSKQIKIIEVKPDQKFIDNLEIKIELAVKAKYKLLSEYMGVELKNKTDYLNFLKQ